MPRTRRRSRTVLPTGFIKGFNDTLHRRLINIISSIFNETPEIAVLKNSITFDRITANGNLSTLGKLNLVNGDNNDPAVVHYREHTHSSIRFAEFSPRNITSHTLNQSNIETSSEFWSKIYNDYWNDRNTSRRFGVNVLKRISVKGYILNFNDVRKLLDESINSRSYNRILDYINEFYYFSKKNCLLAIATTNGSLIIRLQSVKKILELNDDETAKRCLKNLFVCYYKMLEKFIDLNIREVHTETAEIVKQSVLNRVINGDTYSRRFYRHSTNNDNIEDMKRHINDYIQNSLKKAFSGSVFGVDDKYSYAKILNDIIKTRRSQEKYIFRKGFAKGMRIGLKFEMLGWSPSNPKFADNSDDTSMWWEKEVNIIPDSFVYGGKRYLIPETERCFSVKKLYINQDGVMKADANHPNVSGSSVCMGDLRGAVDFSEDSNELQEMLIRVEELLDMVNYDSAYNSARRDHLLDVSEVQETLFATNEESIKSKVRKASSIRELDSDIDDDDDEEEEDIPENEIIHVNDNNNEHIADINVFPQDEEDEESRIHHDDEVEIDQLEAQSVPETNPEYDIIDETIVINDISTVNGAGDQRPLVFNMSQGTNALAESFSLGDDNLIGGNNAQ